MMKAAAASGPVQPEEKLGQCFPNIAVLTRPMGRATELALRLRALGWQALEWPALQLTVVSLEPTRVPLPRAFDLVMFVSGNAVRFYLQQMCMAGMREWPAYVPTAAVGRGTATAIQATLGEHIRIVQPSSNSDSFDSEALWRQLQTGDLLPSLRRVLIVRGGRGAQGHGRGWLAEQLTNAGIKVQLHAAYRREPATWPSARWRTVRHWAQYEKRPLWLFTSVESVEAVCQQAPAGVLADAWRGARLIVTHQRIADAAANLAQSCGVTTRFAYDVGVATDSASVVIQVCLPHDDAVVAAIVN